MEPVEILLANYDRPLVNDDAAKRIAVAVAETYYGPKRFRIKSAIVSDGGKFWIVSLKNAVRADADSVMVVADFIVRVNKRDAKLLGFGY